MMLYEIYLGNFSFSLVSQHPCFNKVLDVGVVILVFYFLFGLQNIIIGVNGIVKVRNSTHEVIVHYTYY